MLPVLVLLLIPSPCAVLERSAPFETRDSEVDETPVGESLAQRAQR